MLRIVIILTLSVLVSAKAYARPVSYPSGWTVMVRNDADQNSAHIHYTFDTQHSFGLRVRNDREADYIFIGAQLNRLVKRWNKRDSQANIYARIGAGNGIRHKQSLAPDQDPDIVPRSINGLNTTNADMNDVVLFLGMSGDWETRRYFISASTEYWDAGRFGKQTAAHGRLGIAPYVAGTGALHSWLMVEGHYRPERETPLGASALIRFFKGPSLVEIGVDDHGTPLLNYIHRF